MSGAKGVNFGTCVSAGLYAGTVLNCSHILLIFPRKNVEKSSASHSAVLPGGIGFLVLFPVSLCHDLEKSFGIFLFFPMFLLCKLAFDIVEL